MPDRDRIGGSGVMACGRGMTCVWWRRWHSGVLGGGQGRARACQGYSDPSERRPRYDMRFDLKHLAGRWSTRTAVRTGLALAVTRNNQVKRAPKVRRVRRFWMSLKHFKTSSGALRRKPLGTVPHQQHETLDARALGFMDFVAVIGQYSVPMSRC